MDENSLFTRGPLPREGKWTGMKISVVVCTYNRSAYLKSMLKSIREAVIPDHLSWELILVDNNSDDDTRLVFEEFERHNDLKAKYVFEQQPGIAHARNRGIQEARGDIIAFTDDDVIVDNYWIQHIEMAFKEHADAACVGGKIVPIWEIPKPQWLKPNLYHMVALLDYGDSVAYLDAPDIWGANFAVRSEVFAKYGLFDSKLGRLPNKLYVGEDTEFVHRLLKANERILYYPLSIIYHCVPAHKLSKQYFRKWRYDEGEMKGMLMNDMKYVNSLNMQSLTRKRMLRNIIISALKIGCFSKDRFSHELRIFYSLGFLSGRGKRMSTK
jgi:glucosyl-dolichyl phosphate glucuronosyltransferase